MYFIIYNNYVVNNPRTINPDGVDDRIEYVTEGSNITLTCTRDHNNAPGDLYQWIHPNGQMTLEVSIDSPIQVTLNNINREERGVYTCQGSRNGVTDSALKNNVTLNVIQCELHLFSNPVILHLYIKYNILKIYLNYQKYTTDNSESKGMFSVNQCICLSVK